MAIFNVNKFKSNENGIDFEEKTQNLTVLEKKRHSNINKQQILKKINTNIIRYVRNIDLLEKNKF